MKPTKSENTMYNLALARAIDLGPRRVSDGSFGSYWLTRAELSGLFLENSFREKPRHDKPVWMRWLAKWIKQDSVRVQQDLIFFRVDLDPDNLGLVNSNDQIIQWGRAHGVTILDLELVKHSPDDPVSMRAIRIEDVMAA